MVTLKNGERDPYSLLGLDPKEYASIEKEHVSAAFRALALEVHPDKARRGAKPGPTVTATLASVAGGHRLPVPAPTFDEIRTARAALEDASARAAIDDELRSQFENEVRAREEVDRRAGFAKDLERREAAAGRANAAGPGGARPSSSAGAGPRGDEAGAPRSSSRLFILREEGASLREALARKRRQPAGPGEVDGPPRKQRRDPGGQGDHAAGVAGSGGEPATDAVNHAAVSLRWVRGERTYDVASITALLSKYGTIADGGVTVRGRAAEVHFLDASSASAAAAAMGTGGADKVKGLRVSGAAAPRSSESSEARGNDPATSAGTAGQAKPLVSGMTVEAPVDPHSVPSRAGLAESESRVLAALTS